MEEELCQAALTCHFARDMIFLCAAHWSILCLAPDSVVVVLIAMVNSAIGKRGGDDEDLSVMDDSYSPGLGVEDIACGRSET